MHWGIPSGYPTHIHIVHLSEVDDCEAWGSSQLLGVGQAEYEGGMQSSIST